MRGVRAQGPQHKGAAAKTRQEDGDRIWQLLPTEEGGTEVGELLLNSLKAGSLLVLERFR